MFPECFSPAPTLLARHVHSFALSIDKVGAPFLPVRQDKPGLHSSGSRNKIKRKHCCCLIFGNFHTRLLVSYLNACLGYSPEVDPCVRAIYAAQKCICRIRPPQPPNSRSPSCRSQPACDSKLIGIDRPHANHADSVLPGSPHQPQARIRTKPSNEGVR